MHVTWLLFCLQVNLDALPDSNSRKHSLYFILSESTKYWWKAHDYFHNGSAISEPLSGTASITSLKAVRCLYADDTKSQHLLVAYISAIHRQKALGERNTGIVRSRFVFLRNQQIKKRDPQVYAANFDSQSLLLKPAPGASNHSSNAYFNHRPRLLSCRRCHMTPTDCMWCGPDSVARCGIAGQSRRLVLYIASSLSLIMMLGCSPPICLAGIDGYHFQHKMSNVWEIRCA